MPTTIDEALESDVPALAVKALTAAHRRALVAGRTLIFVRNGQLIRVGPAGTTVLRQLPARKKVATRTQSAKS